jgi:hypothetical protein
MKHGKNNVPHLSFTWFLMMRRMLMYKGVLRWIRDRRAHGEFRVLCGKKAYGLHFFDTLIPGGVLPGQRERGAYICAYAFENTRSWLPCSSRGLKM